MTKKNIIIGIAGAPNAGKSTLFNQLIGQKLSAVTTKRQTTRFSIRGALTVCSDDNNKPDTQLVFIDTPGLFRPVKELEKRILSEAKAGIDSADILCILFEYRQSANSYANAPVLEYLRRIEKRCVAIINKIDLVKEKSLLLPTINRIQVLHHFERIFVISAKTGSGVEDVVRYLTQQAKDSQWLFDDDNITDITERKLAEELTREQLYMSLGNELPYTLEVQTELWQEKWDGSVKICQIIHVLKESHKPIILGAKGQRIKIIGRNARHNIKKAIGRRQVHLFLYIKVKPDWLLYHT